MKRWAVVTSIIIAIGGMLLGGGAWRRSHRTVDWISIGDTHLLDRGLLVWSADGAVAISLTRPSSDPSTTFHHSFAFDPDDHAWRVQRSTYSAFELFGFASFSLSRVPAKYNGGPTSVRETLLMPYWLLCALFPIVAGIPLGTRYLRRRLRMSRGRCAGCGYDLRGSPSSACPECGTPQPPVGHSPDAAKNLLNSADFRGRGGAAVV